MVSCNALDMHSLISEQRRYFSDFGNCSIFLCEYCIICSSFVCSINGSLALANRRSLSLKIISPKSKGRYRGPYSLQSFSYQAMASPYLASRNPSPASAPPPLTRQMNGPTTDAPLKPP